VLCLCEYVEGIETYYDINKEIITFSDRNAMIGLMDYHLNHDAEREAIAQAGYERVMKEHKWEDRLSEIFSKISAK
jgi:spore maturation protein CgeB